ncbi:MAG: hypothetical protein WBM90_10665 [Acidimicrobiia bacterium]
MTRNNTPDAPPTRLVLLLPLLIAAAALFLAVEEEPYHIDELRQTRSYSMPITEVIERSFAQDQPPLDAVLNAVLQRAIGIGDWQQRALSVVFALTGLYMFGLLLYGAGFGWGTFFGMLVLATSPLLVSVFAYARPYALPFCLTAGFVLVTNQWLSKRNRWLIPIMFAVAVLLPLSRTIEPNLVLGATVAVMLFFRFTGRHQRFEGSIWAPVAASALGILAVGMPVMLHLRAQLTGYTESGLIPSSGQVRRLVTDLPDLLAQSLPLWPAVVVLLGVALILPGSRGLLIHNWWVWVLAILPVGFISLFLLTTSPEQPLFERYLFTWIPLLGVLVGSLFSKREPQLIWLLGVVAGGTILISSLVTLGYDVGTRERGDWSLLSEAITDQVPSDWIVVHEHLGPIDAYRTPFAGRPRYLPNDWVTPRISDLVENADVIAGDQHFAIVIATDETGQRSPQGPFEVSGWDRVEVDGFFSLYLPETDLRGPIAMARSFLLFADSMSDSPSGYMLELSAASLLAENGEFVEACDVWLTRLAEVEPVASFAKETEMWTDSC